MEMAEEAEDWKYEEIFLEEEIEKVKDPMRGMSRRRRVQCRRKRSMKKRSRTFPNSKGQSGVKTPAAL